MGNSRDYKDTMNRGDTSAGSAYSPKTIEESNRINTGEITKVMRKTNFILGFKSDTSHNRLE
jgi:hypothetical protein